MTLREWAFFNPCAQLQASCPIVLFMLQPKGSFLEEIPHLCLWQSFSFNLPQELDFTLVYVSLLNFCKAWWRSNAGFLLICAWMIMIPFSTASHLYCAFNGRYSHILLRLDQTGSAMTPEIIEHIFPPSQLRLQIRPFELGNVETAKSKGYPFCQPNKRL